MSARRLEEPAFFAPRVEAAMVCLAARCPRFGSTQATCSRSRPSSRRQVPRERRARGRARAARRRRDHTARARVGRGEAKPHAPIALGGEREPRDALGAPGRHVARLELTLDAAAEGSAAAAVALPFAIDAESGPRRGRDVGYRALAPRRACSGDYGARGRAARDRRALSAAVRGRRRGGRRRRAADDRRGRRRARRTPSSTTSNAADAQGGARSTSGSSHAGHEKIDVLARKLSGPYSPAEQPRRCGCPSSPRSRTRTLAARAARTSTTATSTRRGPPGSS